MPTSAHYFDLAREMKNPYHHRPRLVESAKRGITLVTGHLDRDGFELMGISAQHAIRAGLLPSPHKDPFDRMLIAQAQAENIPIISNEALLESYGVRRIW